MRDKELRAWVDCRENEPYLSDRLVLVHFENGNIDTVHVEDFFREIPNGVENGVQKYTKWFLHSNPKCTHWMELPAPPDVEQGA